VIQARDMVDTASERPRVNVILIGKVGFAPSCAADGAEGFLALGVGQRRTPSMALANFVERQCLRRRGISSPYLETLVRQVNIWLIEP
jgi:hypothetical protein